MTHGTPNETKRKISILKEHCNSIGRDIKDIQYSVVLPCIIRESEEEANQNPHYIQKKRQNYRTIY